MLLEAILAHLDAMLDYVGPCWRHLGHRFADVGTSWWQAGARQRQDGDQEGQVEPAWAAWKLPDRKDGGGWVVKAAL